MRIISAMFKCLPPRAMRCARGRVRLTPHSLTRYRLTPQKPIDGLVPTHSSVLTVQFGANLS